MNVFFQRRSLHRIVRAAHCRHCNSAECLQYENCVNFKEHNWISTQRSEPQPQLADHNYSSHIDCNWSIDDEIDLLQLKQQTQQQATKHSQQPHTGTVVEVHREMIFIVFRRSPSPRLFLSLDRDSRRL